MIIDVLNDLQFEDKFKKYRKSLLVVFSSPDCIPCVSLNEKLVRLTSGFPDIYESGQSWWGDSEIGSQSTLSRYGGFL